MNTGGEIARGTGQLHTKTAGRLGTVGAVLRVRNFRLLWMGQGISVLGDQFYLIALPWLVLQLTGDALAVGTVLALVAFPRAIFMLVGGALIDRFSPRKVMLASDALRMTLVALLTLLILTGSIQMWMLYGFALLFGLAAAFFYPAQPALIPQLLEEEELQIGNVLNMGTAQLGLFVGPVVAGGLIALLDSGSAQGASGTSHTLGIALAFGIDAFSFLVSLVTLWLIHLPATKKADQTAGKKVGMFASIRTGLVHAWSDYPVRLLIMFLAAIMLLINGPFVVVIPVLSASRFAGGAAAFGVIMSAFGGGALLGMILAGVLPKLPPRYTLSVILAVISSMSIAWALLGLVTSTLLAALLALAMGTANGYIEIMLITWVQKRTPPQMQGRMMSLAMFVTMGLTPISTPIAGALVKLNPTLFLLVTGTLAAALSLVAALNFLVREKDTAELNASLPNMRN
jgi:MFS family permease